MDFARKVVSTFVHQGVTLVVGLGASILLGRLLGPEDLGTFSVIVAAPALLISLSAMGIPTANTYFISRHPDDIKRYVANTVVFTFVVGAILAGVWALGVGLLQEHYFDGDADRALLYFVIPMLPLLVFLNVGPSILHGAYRITPLNLVWVFNAFGRVALYLVMLWWLDLGIKGALAGLLIVHGLVNVYLLVAIWRTVGMSLRPTLGRFRETFSYGWRAYIGSLTGELTINLVTLILGAILVPAQVGLFIVARTLANFANAPARAVYVPLLPRVSRSSGSEGEQIIGRVVRGVLYLSIVTAGGMLLAVPFAVPLLYGDSFDGAVVVAMILLPGVLADTLSNTMQIYFLGTGQPMMRSYLNVARLILVVGGLAIASLDATAVAAATAVTVAGLAGLVLTSLLLVLRTPNLRVRDLWMPTIADWTYFRRAVRRRA